MTIAAEALKQSRQVIDMYEAYADRYDEIVGSEPIERVQAALKRLAAEVGTDGQILEIGSGAGREADFLEDLGLHLRRTDATRRFLEIQAARGKQADLLDVVADELGGPYDAVVALCVLFYVRRAEIEAVLGKVAQSLRPGGVFLVSMRHGDGEKNGEYQTVLWRRDDFARLLEDAGMAVVWDEFAVNTGNGEEWISFLAVKGS
ncbi:methyltransferase [Mesorhizobium sp. 1M-11]|uniref:class I SAM-dependent DNA methyltransferase n=1 Tax=Mesorhizobium sp. 1M-11 TaxID=1529006 RepID=UPI0006C73B19|nr:methyltransferase [Mesorhizobium sp. 1M-11]